MKSLFATVLFGFTFLFTPLCSIAVETQSNERRVAWDMLDSQEDFQGFVLWYGKSVSDSSALNLAFRDTGNANRAGASHLYVDRSLGDGFVLVNSTQILDRGAAKSILESFENSADVRFVQPDGIKTAQGYPDPFLSEQWHLESVHPTNDDRGGVDAGVNALAGWSYSTGANILVAVLDTGYTNHPDFGTCPSSCQFLWRTQPGYPQGGLPLGYDFVTDIYGYDNNDYLPPGPLGRDFDAFDPGTYGDEDSNWHGTHVMGLIAAVRNNGIGGAGVAPDVKIIPVRVLGKNGFGRDSDITDAIKWASGAFVEGVPTLSPPAKVINLSLGAVQQCTPLWQTAIDIARANGSVVVAAAGNYGSDANVTPASCNGVIAVAGTKKNGSKYEASSFGPKVDVSAPGGGALGIYEIKGQVRFDIYSTIALGPQQVTGYSYKKLDGTSFAAPQVSGLAAQILSLNPALTPDAVESLIKAHARPWGPEGGLPVLNPGITLGTGLVDIAATLAAVSQSTPPPTITASPNPVVVSSGQPEGYFGMNWTAPGYSNVDIKLSMNGGTPFMWAPNAPANGSSPSINGIPLGMTYVFSMYPAGNSTTVLESLTVTSVSAQMPTLEADPNPVIVPDGQPEGYFSMNWTAPGYSNVDIKLSMNGGTPFMWAPNAPASGSSPSINGIPPGFTYVFTMYPAGQSTPLLKSMTVTANN